MSIPDVFCNDCGLPYPSDGVPYRCPTCNGLYDYGGVFQYDKDRVELSQPGIWRYRHTFGLPNDLEPVSLGEGNTPMVWTRDGAGLA